MQLERILNKEHQLGDMLAKSVEQDRRADFSLCLAMLSPNVLDFSVFHLPESEKHEPDRSEEALKKELQIGPQQKMAPEKFDMLIGQHNSRLFHEQGLTELRLRNCLAPEPLHIRDDKKHIELAIVDNCEPTVQAKIFAQRAGALEFDKPKMDAAGFYDQLASGEMQQAIQLSA
jgi:hypothetical protein